MPCSEEAGTVWSGSVAGGGGAVELAETVVAQPVTSVTVSAPRAVMYSAREGRDIGHTVGRPD